MGRFAGEDFNRLFSTYVHTAFRLETRDHYAAAAVRARPPKPIRTCYQMVTIGYIGGMTGVYASCGGAADG
jgi:hypothetical protein